MTDRLNMIQSLTCLSCGDILTDPITLSCGYTICAHCFPVSSPTLIKKSIFSCPAPHCDTAAHLFGPEVVKDSLVSQITHTLRHSIPDGPPSPAYDNDDLEKPLDIMEKTVIPLLKCSYCQDLLVNPITAPCGHTFCRLCVLQLKVETDSCKICSSPFPKYSFLIDQNTNHVISRIIKDLQLYGFLPYYTRETSFFDTLHLRQTDVPLFVSGKVILPGQHARLPLLAPSHLQMFRSSLVPSSRYNALCLAAVHRSRPQVAQFGTILQIVNVERQNEILFLEVVGIDRLKLESHRESPRGLVADLDILSELTVPIISMDLNTLELDRVSQYAIDLADSILQDIHHLCQPSSIPPHVLHSQTTGILGPLWLESMKSLHGPLPTKKNPPAVVWWAAAALPISNNELYVLLRTMSLIDRLEVVTSWMQNFQQQWTHCRKKAMNAFLQVPQEP